MIICDLCGETKDCLQKEIEGKEYDICAECWKPIAYILVGQGKDRRVVILADGGLRYNAEYPVVALAARVPKEFVRNINWADPSPPQFQGDSLLVVRLMIPPRV